MPLSNNHWVLATYKQRMTTKEWKEILLNYEEQIIFRGNLIRLIGKKVGPGVYEVGKEEEDGKG